MNIEKYNEKMFEDIKHIDENGIEYWYARELQVVLDYKEWRKFENVIDKAKVACQHSNIDANEQFVSADKMSINVNSLNLQTITIIFDFYELRSFAKRFIRGMKS